MSNKKHCDQCEIVIDDLLTVYYEVRRSGKLDSWAHFDFCSKACLLRWAQTEEDVK